MNTFIASSFRIWNSSTGIPSPPLTLFVVMLPKAHLTLHSRMFGSRRVITPLWLSICEVKVKVVQPCQTLCNPMDYTVHGIFHARILEWVAFPFSRASMCTNHLIIVKRFYEEGFIVCQHYWEGNWSTESSGWVAEPSWSPDSCGLCCYTSHLESATPVETKNTMSMGLLQ